MANNTTGGDVRDLAIVKEESEETLSLARLSEPSFAEDWNSPEDSIYDLPSQRRRSPTRQDSEASDEDLSSAKGLTQE